MRARATLCTAVHLLSAASAYVDSYCCVRHFVPFRLLAARDELRLGAMLFALHLNAASVSSASASVQDATQIAGLSAYRLGDVDVRFCESATSDLLLVLFAPMTLGAPAATFLAAEILRSFEHRFGEQLRQQQAQPHGSATPGGSARASIKRSAFTDGLHAAVGALPAWILDRMLDQTARLTLPSAAGTAAAAATTSNAATASPPPTLSVHATSLAVMHSTAMCAALHRPSNRPSSGASLAIYDADHAASGDAKRRRKGAGTKSRRTDAAASPPPLLSLLGLAEMDEAGYERGRGGGGGVDVGCFGCLRAQRTLPPPRSSAKSASGPVLPVLIWRDGGLAGRAAAKAAALEDAIGTPSGDAGPPIPGAAAVNQLHVLVRELQAAWRHKHLQSAGAIYSPPEGTAHEDDEAEPYGKSEGCSPKLPSPVASASPPAVCVNVVLLRKPVLLRVRATVRGITPTYTDTGAAANRHGMGNAAAEAQLPAVAAALAEAAQPWVAPLALSLAFLAEFGQARADKAAERAASTPARSLL